MIRFSETVGYEVSTEDWVFYKRLPDGMVRRWIENDEWCDCCPKDLDEIIELTPELDEELSQLGGLPRWEHGVIYNSVDEVRSWREVRYADDRFFVDGRYKMAAELDLAAQIGPFEWDGKVIISGSRVDTTEPQESPAGMFDQFGHRVAHEQDPGEYRGHECYTVDREWAGRFVQLSKGNWWRIF